MDCVEKVKANIRTNIAEKELELEYYKDTLKQIEEANEDEVYDIITKVSYSDECDIIVEFISQGMKMLKVYEGDLDKLKCMEISLENHVKVPNYFKTYEYLSYINHLNEYMVGGYEFFSWYNVKGLDFTNRKELERYSARELGYEFALESVRSYIINCEDLIKKYKEKIVVFSKML